MPVPPLLSCSCLLMAFSAPFYTQADPLLVFSLTYTQGLLTSTPLGCFPSFPLCSKFLDSLPAYSAHHPWKFTSLLQLSHGSVGPLWARVLGHHAVTRGVCRERILSIGQERRLRPTLGVWLGLDGPWGSCLPKTAARPRAGLTWGWKSSGDGRRYFSFRAPTGSGTFRFSTLLDSNTEGYVPSERPPGSCLGPIAHEVGDLTQRPGFPRPPDGCEDFHDPATLLPA